MLKYSEGLYSELVMEAYLQFKDVPIAEVLLMRYVDVAVTYLEEKYEGEILPITEEGKLEWININDLPKIKQFDQNKKFTPYLFKDKLFEGKYKLDDNCMALEYEIRSM